MTVYKLTLLMILQSVCSAFTPSILSFNGGQVSKYIESRSDYQKYLSCSRIIENMFCQPQGPVEKRPGTKLMAPSPFTLCEREITWEYISENGAVWALPYIDETHILTLDAGGAARTIVNGGLGYWTIGLPLECHPFNVGDRIIIYNTVSYDGEYILQSQTTANELAILKLNPNNETFTGDEVVIRKFDMDAGPGRMVQDSSFNLYCATQGTNCLTKIEPDGDIVEDFFEPNEPWPGSGYIQTGLKITDDSKYLYVYQFENNQDPELRKFDLTTGHEIWRVHNLTGFYYMAIDSDDNVYMARDSGSQMVLYKYAASDGAETQTLIGNTHDDTFLVTIYHIQYDSSLDKIILAATARHMGSDDSNLYNIAICDTDGSNYTQKAVGGTKLIDGFYQPRKITSDQLIVRDDYIYCVASRDDCMIYKVDANLDIIDSNQLDYAIGLFFDVWDNLIVVKMDGSNDPNIFHIYDTEINELGTTHIYPYFLGNWSGGTVLGLGSAWYRGNVAFKSPRETIEIYNSPGVPVTDEPVGKVRLIPYEYSTNDAYIIEFGNKYMRYYRNDGE